MKIAFFIQHMLCGGVENALLSLVNELIDQGNKVSIYMVKERGKFVDKIPTSVHKDAIPMPENIRSMIPCGGIKLSIKEALTNRQIIQAFIMAMKFTLNRKGFAELNVDFSKIPKLNERYDIAVNFHIHSPFLVKYLAEKVNADKKYTWIHNDFTTTGYEIGKLYPYLMCIDHFFCVAEKLKIEFIDIFPEYKNKTDVALNIVPVNEILSKAEEFYPQEYKNVTSIKLLTVGRVEEQKGYDIAVNVAKELLKEEIDYQWFILGDGSLRQSFERVLENDGLSDKMHFLGIRMNPYPYFKNCDIYVQTSRHEGYVTTVTEAKIFNKPIVCTDVSGAREQIDDGISGDIAMVNAESVANKVMRLIREPIRRKSYEFHLALTSYSEKPEWLKCFE